VYSIPGPGVEATASGYRVVSHLPMSAFSIRLPSVGLAQQPGLIRGYLRAADGELTLQVAPPPGVAADRAVTYADGAVVPHTVVDGLEQFSLRTAGQRPADWAVTGPA
jgi:hypothetical protein